MYLKWMDYLLMRFRCAHFIVDAVPVLTNQSVMDPFVLLYGTSDRGPAVNKIM